MSEYRDIRGLRVLCSEWGDREGYTLTIRAGENVAFIVEESWPTPVEAWAALEGATETTLLEWQRAAYVSATNFRMAKAFAAFEQEMKR